jgi:hypothetical protein
VPQPSIRLSLSDLHVADLLVIFSENVTSNTLFNDTSSPFFNRISFNFKSESHFHKLLGHIEYGIKSMAFLSRFQILLGMGFICMAIHHSRLVSNHGYFDQNNYANK